MAIENSTLEQLTERVRNQFSAILPDSDSWLYPNNIWIVATVIAGLFWEALGTVRKIPELVMPDTASGEYLERWAALYGIQRILSAKATGKVMLDGIVGTSIPVGTVFNGRGQSFVSTTLPVWTGNAATFSIEAQQDGDQANLPAGTPLYAGSEIAGAHAYIVGAGGIAGGLCNETDTELRERLLLRMRSRQRYGTICDFKEWATEVAGVSRAWAKNEAGGINVYVELNGAALEEVNTYLNDECRKPVCAVVKAVETIPQPLHLTLSCEAAPSDAEKAVINHALQQWLFDHAAPGLCIPSSEIERALCRIDRHVQMADELYCPDSPAHVFSGVNINFD